MTVPHSSADLSELIAWKQQISTYSGLVATRQQNTQGNSALAEAAIIPRPDSKTTTSTSAAARAKANEPYVADMQSEHPGDGVKWFPKLDVIDPVRGREALATPAFRTTNNKCLTTKQVATTLRHLCGLAQ